MVQRAKRVLRQANQYRNRELDPSRALYRARHGGLLRPPTRVRDGWGVLTLVAPTASVASAVATDIVEPREKNSISITKRTQDHMAHPVHLFRASTTN